MKNVVNGHIVFENRHCASCHKDKKMHEHVCSHCPYCNVKFNYQFSITQQMIDEFNAFLKSKGAAIRIEPVYDTIYNEVYEPDIPKTYGVEVVPASWEYLNPPGHYEDLQRMLNLAPRMTPAFLRDLFTFFWNNGVCLDFSASHGYYEYGSVFRNLLEWADEYEKQDIRERDKK